MNDEISTLSNILDVGKKEFLQKGFIRASLRNIVKEAGVTTGAFYGYYQNKEELFDALVEAAANTLLDQYTRAHQMFGAMPPEEQRDNMNKISSNCMAEMLDYMYDHFVEVKLLLCCSEGTKYEHFIHTLVEIEVKSTHQFQNSLKGIGTHTKEIDPQLEHILISGFFSAFFEIIIHDMSKEKAVTYIKELEEFFAAGWTKVMGL